MRRWHACTQLTACACSVRREQNQRDELKAERLRNGSALDLFDEAGGALTDSDPYSTNLYVGNLATSVDEEVCTLFDFRVHFCMLLDLFDEAGGALTDSNPYSTNLYMGDLAASVDEEVSTCEQHLLLYHAASDRQQSSQH